MTHKVIETDPTTIQEQSYFVPLESDTAKCITKELITWNEVYANGLTNPDLGTKRIYKVQGFEIGSDAARMIEADVLLNDRRWNQSRDETAADNRGFEHNSIFFILVDGPDEDPELVGSLRVADCGQGKSETEQFYGVSYGSSELPVELQMADGREGVWDIVYATVRQEYQDNINASWLYFAMHKHSLEQGVKEWISNITDVEFKMLSILGIPFKPMQGVDKVAVINPITGKKQRFGFYRADATKVHQSVEDKADALIDRDALEIATYALISRFGSFSRPEKQP